MDKRWIEKEIYVFTKEDISEIYNDSLQTKKRIFLLFSVIVPSVVALICCVILTVNEIVKPNIGDIGFYATDGETSVVVPSINPAVTNENAYGFAVDAAIQIRTFFFSTYYKDLTALEPLFTPEAYNDFLLTLNASGLLTRVKAESLNVTAALSPSSEINALSVYQDGANHFYVRVKIMLRIENLSGDDQFESEDLFFNLIEVDRGRSKRGLQIYSLEPF
ncbi:MULTISPECIES: DotI/IcmL/TraM family protein [Pseudoalteromonas]|uniref:DotI/IcmL/TraM family protein n=1 Tax=Pseudoalteromonas TaxID=53246 RepID=UPI00158293D6|nr:MULTISPECIES: DotI/IcmL/TraM family protein [Pseudoalteromonas]MDI4652594.1 DotI/IcmL/TraM family protein [Pseudoalteromonas shioyasakiensis]NUJ38698.1 DotI/IcmL/TraM family protein [Pseudoalteromonas sp. 0303]